MIKSMYGTQDVSHIWPLDYVTLICGVLGVFRRDKHSAALFHNPNEDVRIAVHGDDLVFVCQTKTDSIMSTNFSNSNAQEKTWEHMESKSQT